MWTLNRNIFLAGILLIASLAGCSMDDPAYHDAALMGEWEGERDPATKCQFLAWTGEYRPDGTFSTRFYRESEKIKKIYTKYGYWVAAKGKLILTVHGQGWYDIYNYTVIDANTIRFTSISTYANADCKEHYVFIDHRVQKQGR
jgi:hypothetical protein